MMNGQTLEAEVARGCSVEWMELCKKESRNGCCGKGLLLARKHLPDLFTSRASAVAIKLISNQLLGIQIVTARLPTLLPPIPILS